MSLFTDELEVKAQELELQTVQKIRAFSRGKKILLIFFLIGIIPAYILARIISQGYWSGQYKNFLISARPSFVQAKDVKVQEIGVFPTGSNTYTAYAYVSNENLELSAKKATYIFTFYDSAGGKVASDTGDFFILPNEKKYLVAPKVQTPDKVTKATISFKDVQWQKKTSIPSVKINALQPNLYDQFDPLALVVEGTIVNPSPYLLSEVRIVFLLYDRNHKLVSVSQRQEFTVKSGERRTYKQLWPNLQTTQVASVQVFAETNVLNSVNLSTQTPAVPGGATGSSNLGR
jgi:hypothetical protein